MLQILVRPTWLDICCADKHLGLIKHLVQTVKEQVHCTRLMKKLLIEYLVYWINKLPTNNGIVNDRIPSEILQGEPNVDCKHLKIILVSYL